MSSLFEHGIPYKYGQQDEAYKNFVNISNFNSTQINLLLSEIRSKYKKIIVGVPLLPSFQQNVTCAMESMPSCPVLVILVKFEKSFEPSVLQKKLADKKTVTCHVLNSHHGFSGPYNETYSCRNREIA